MSEPWRPHAGQKKAVKFLLEHAAAALLADPGVGKTSAVYAAFSFLKKRGLAAKMLVIAPLRPAQLVWPAEREKWKDFGHLRVVVLHGPKKDALLHEEADVYVINPDGLDWLLDAKRITGRSGKIAVTCDVRAFRKLGFDTLVVDELTQFKNQNSGRFKALKAVIDTFGRRWGLTGTPVPNGLIDLFGQMYVLDQGRAFGQFVTHFRREYFLPGYDGFSWVLQKGAEDRIYARIKPLALRLDAADYVDMPALVEDVKRFDLSPAVRKIYDELEEDLFTQIEEDAIVAGNAAAASTKLRQIVSGGLYLADADAASLAPAVTRRKAKGRDWLPLHDEKTDMLTDLVEELQGTPLLVAYDFAHSLERIKDRFGKDVPAIGGGTSPKRAAELEKAWNRGELPLLVGHPQSIGHGLNLQNAGNHIAWYDETWNRELLDQFNGRIRRQGSKHQTVFVHHFLAHKTLDEKIFYVVKAKGRVQDALLLALKEKVRRR